VLLTRTGQLASAATRADEAKDGVAFREGRDIARDLSANRVPAARQLHKAPSTAPDARDIPALEAPPKRRT